MNAPSMTAASDGAVAAGAAASSRPGILSRAQWQRMGLRSLSVLMFFVLWYAVTLSNAYVFKAFNPILLPPPDVVLQKGIEMVASGELQMHILASMSRVIQGFLIAAFAGIALGTIVGRSRLMENLIEPMFELLRPIPPLAFLPMMVLWFGIGEGSKIMFIAYAAFFPIFTTTVEGIKYVDPLLLRAAASLGASERDLFRHVVLPAAMPSIITGLRLAFALSFFVIVAAEFIAADSGLGYLINDARTFFLVSQMLLGAAVIGIIGFTFNVLLRRLEAHLLRWRKRERR
jgi:ABC-type nitrate/sulfonate/bicarbonate transport system permease component